MKLKGCPYCGTSMCYGCEEAPSRAPSRTIALAVLGLCIVIIGLFINGLRYAN